MWAAIRIRGRVGVRREVRDTLDMLRLRAPHNCVILPETPSFRGMLVRARDMLTWGEVDHKTLTRLLSKRLRSKMAGNRKVDEQVLKQVTGFNSFDQFAQALLAGKVKLKDFSQLKLTFRLTPPSGGFKSVREHWPRGDLGYRGKKINELLERMM